jgi:molecular chaperone HtpG
MAQGTLKIHTENILPIIKRWLYSDKDIFIRELVSNACDALCKLKILRDQNLVEFKDEELKI